MKIVIIGSGNVAYHLVKAFSEKGVSLVQVFGRNEKALKEISSEFGIPYSTNELAEADLHIISVKDDAIAEVSSKIKNKNALVAHTSGSTSKNVLEGEYRKASFYPLQTFSKKKALNYSEIPFFIDAETEEDRQILLQLAQKISKKIMFIDDEKRKYIHLAAVFSCNFVNHLWAKTQEITDRQDIPFEYFLPLIDETLDKIKYLSPKEAQTGPAVRNDEKTLQLHEQIIENEEQKQIYKVFNQSIKKMYEL
ncbi:MAG: DUF2520 domain-containing protein [Flavobacteriaceae bacterium]|nr:DUF2520 domain-containing protein [Flavobacteriaceae bacterium]